MVWAHTSRTVLEHHVVSSFDVWVRQAWRFSLRERSDNTTNPRLPGNAGTPVTIWGWFILWFILMTWASFMTMNPTVLHDLLSKIGRVFFTCLQYFWNYNIEAGKMWNTNQEDLFVGQSGKDFQPLSVSCPPIFLDYLRLSQADFSIPMGNNSGVDDLPIGYGYFQWLC